MITCKFNRHEEMTITTRHMILSFISNRNFKSVQDELYGLFDGYFYSTILKAKANDANLTNEERTYFNSMLDTISKYKSLTLEH